MILGTGIGRKSIREFAQGSQRYHEVGKFFSFFFLPLFPLGKMLLKQVGEAQWQELRHDSAEYQRIQEATGGFGRFGLSFFWGWGIPLVMALSVFMALEDEIRAPRKVNFQFSPEDEAMMEWGKEMHNRLADPHVGDYYIMKFPEEEPAYVLYKVQEVSNDSIYCYSSKIGWMELEFLHAAIADSSHEKQRNFWYKEVVFPFSVAELESLYLLPDSLVVRGKGKIIEPLRYEAPSVPAAGDKSQPVRQEQR
jgi:hypothetical protein